MKLSIEEIQQLLPDSHLRLDRRKLNLYGKCPKCGEDEFGISLADNHQFGCFRKKKCGFNGNIYVLSQFLGKPLFTVRRGVEAFAERLENPLDKEDEVIELDMTLPNVIAPLGWKRIYDHPYLNERGFTTREYNKYMVGTTKIDPRYKQDFVIFLIHRDNELKAFIARSTKSKEEIKKINETNKLLGIKGSFLRYKNSSTDFSKLLGGYDEIVGETDTVVLVEGLFDKIAVDRLLGLDDNPNVKCCNTWKCGCSDEQIHLLLSKGIEHIILLYDPDVVEEIKHTAYRLESYFPDVLVGFNKEGQDPGDMTEEQMGEVLSTLKTPSQFAMSVINVQTL